jgi:hypothetical protein
MDNPHVICYDVTLPAMKRIAGYTLSIGLLICIAVPLLFLVPGLALVGYQVVAWPFGIDALGLTKVLDTIGIINALWILAAIYVGLAIVYEACTSYSRKHPFVSPLCFTLALFTVHLLVGIVLGNMGIIAIGDP